MESPTDAAPQRVRAVRLEIQNQIWHSLPLMAKKIFSRVLCALTAISGVAHTLPLNYETYLESWDSGWQSALQNLPPGPNGTTATSYQNVTLNVCFAAYVFPGLNGLQFSTSDVTTAVNFVHTHGGKARISFGGASYAQPWYPNYFISQTEGWPGNASSLASGVLSVVSTYNLDGVDFDIEDPQPSGVTAQQFAGQLITFLQYVRAGLPAGKTMSITVAGQGWNTYVQYLTQGVAAIPGLVDYINFMEYDIWVNSALPQGYPEQISADLTTYTSPTTESPAPNYAPGWGIPESLIQLGLMPGNDDIGNVLTLDDAQSLSQLVVDQNYVGVMTWDLDRDAGTDPNPPTNESPYAYSNEIRSVIGVSEDTAAAVEKAKPYHEHRMRNQRYAPFQSPFIRQPVPPHGAP